MEGVGERGARGGKGAGGVGVEGVTVFNDGRGMGRGREKAGLGGGVGRRGMDWQGRVVWRVEKWGLSISC